MATLDELHALSQQAGFEDLLHKVRAAGVIKAVALLESVSPTQAQIDWAQGVLSNPAGAANELIWYVIGANESASVAQILGATDNAIQTNVNAAADAITGV